VFIFVRGWKRGRWADDGLTQELDLERVAFDGDVKLQKRVTTQEAAWARALGELISDGRNGEGCVRWSKERADGVTENG
jgi:hypothetical protein